MTTGPILEDGAMGIMKAAVFVEPAWIVLDEKPVPGSAGRSPVRITTTTICGTDIDT